MGNCFGKEKSFQGEGRTLGATPVAAPAGSKTGRSAVPAKPYVSSKGQTLGASGEDPSSRQPPGAAAANAAEVRIYATKRGTHADPALVQARLKASQGKGRLGKQLDAQKSQTQSDVLAQNARDNLAARNADAATEARNYN